MENPVLAQINTSDGFTLPGLLYEAPDTRKAMIFLQGNGSSSVFYEDDQRYELADALRTKGISFLLFNNRGAHYIKKLHSKKNGKESSKLYGMAYEKIRECLTDIDGAISFLEKKGYTEFYLIGESTGANKICVYHYYKPKNKIAKYILVSGGDDTGIYYDMLGKEKFYRLLKEAKEKIAGRQGASIISELLPDLVISYRSFYDTCNPDGDYNVFPYLEAIKHITLSTKPLFRFVRSITKPTLVIYGAKDQYALGGGRKSAQILQSYCPEFTYKIVAGADHTFSEHQKEYAAIVSGWI